MYLFTFLREYWDVFYIFFIFRWSKLWSEIKLKILYGVNILLPINYIYIYIFKEEPISEREPTDAGRGATT